MRTIALGKKIIFVPLFSLLIIGCSFITNATQANALSGSNFNAGHIIDDSVFYNASEMSSGQIQQFLNAKVPTCDTNGTQDRSGQTRAAYGTSIGYPPPYTCLKDYRTNTVSKPYEAGLCNGYPAANHSAAEVIYNVAQSCGINPKVLIVLLQKEQGLITDDWPWTNQYRSATGYGCPDTAPCDAEYYGFFNQVYAAARQYKYYAKSPGSFNFRAGRNNFIGYNPDGACGGSSVYIQNQATAGLYNYTPYQPNQAALAVMNDSTPGGSVHCGAYGNRNFFWYYTKWFGSPIRSLIGMAGGGVYYVDGAYKRVFPSEIAFLSYGHKWSDVLITSYADMNQIPDGPAMPYNTHFRDGILVRSPGGGVYVISDGLKKPFPNEGTFFSYGYTWPDALVISRAEVNMIPEGTAMQYNVHLRDGYLVTSPSGGMYVVSNGLKKPFPNEIAFLSYKYRWTDALMISYAEMSIIPDGSPMPYNTNFRNGYLITSPGGGIYVVSEGFKKPFPNEATFYSYGYTFADALVIGRAEVGMIPDGSPMPYKQ